VLSGSIQRDIDEALREAERPRAAASDALKIVQRHHGWVSDEHLGEVAARLDMTAAELDSLATFYSGIYRRPVGRHVIQLCDSIACWIMGCHPLREHLTARLGITWGETTADGRFTLLPAACLGVCEQAPAMIVDEDVHGNLTPAKMDEILNKYE
jgi:NADH-quinone oxidoreductase subunit E